MRALRSGPACVGPAVLVMALVACAPPATAPAAASELGLPRLVAQAVVEGGPNPPARTVTLFNRGSCPLSYSVDAFTSDGQAWLSVSPTSGTVPADGSVALSFTFDPQSLLLTPGVWTGTVLVSGTCQTTGQPARGSPRSVAVNLQVVPNTGALVDEWLVFDGTERPTPREGAGIAAAYLPTAGATRRSLVFGGVDGGGAPMAAPFIHELGVGWTSLAGLPNEPSPRVAHRVEPFFSETAGALVWGGLEASGAPTQTGAALIDNLGLEWVPTPLAGAPSARSLHSLTASGPVVLAWGGLDGGGQVLGDGAAYITDVNVWQAVPTAGAPTARARHVGVAVSGRIVIWGGEVAGGAFTNTGGRYVVFSSTWLPLSTVGAPSARVGMVAASTGIVALVWGGRSAAGVVGDGARYDPLTDTWTPMSMLGAPSPREGHTGAWSGTRFIVWGGRNGAGQLLGDGAAYDPDTDSWAPVSLLGAPDPRAGHVATWEEDRMLVVTGRTATGVTETGKAYR